VQRPPKTISRQLRRSYISQRRRDERHELAHDCAVTRSAHAAGLKPDTELGLPILLFHDVHRALGEPSCPKCPECTALKKGARIDPRPAKERVLKKWSEVLGGYLAKQQLALDLGPDAER
jgi:hypothetical protein